MYVYLHWFFARHCPALGPAEVRLERFWLLLFKGDWVHTYVRMIINASAFEYPDFDLRMTDGLSDLAVGKMPAISAGNRE